MVVDLTMIAGQKPVTTKAKKSIAASLREVVDWRDADANALAREFLDR